MKPDLLIMTYTIIPPEYMAKFNEMFNVHYAPTFEEQEEAFRKDWMKNVRAVFTMGSRGVKPEILDLMPRLEIVCCKGAGYDGFDIAEMNRRGIAISHGLAVNATYVADHAIALMLATIRRIVMFDAAVRRGEWVTGRSLPPSITGKRLGIVGLGQIGSKIAERCHRGFSMTVGYHTRHRRPAFPYRHYTNPVELAADSDFLMLVCPGGKATHHLVGGKVLDALGPEGYLINMARGTVVDNAALIPALQEGRIAGAGLDVVEGEPVIPHALLELTNVTMTPHVGGHAPESAAATLDLVISNLQAHFAGKPLLTPIPGSTGGHRAEGKTA